MTHATRRLGVPLTSIRSCPALSLFEALIFLVVVVKEGEKRKFCVEIPGGNASFTLFSRKRPEQTYVPSAMIKYAHTM